MSSQAYPSDTRSSIPDSDSSSLKTDAGEPLREVFQQGLGLEHHISDKTYLRLDEKIENLLPEAKPGALLVATNYTTFRHPPLADPKNEMRLLEVEAGVGDAEIRCKLHVHNRKDLPKYEAISYTWGDSRATRDVRIDGNIMTVSENCWTALQQVRIPDESRLIWIDAISINQRDGNEKGHQVQEMAKVFQNAYKVLVSLGTDTYDADFLLHWVNELFYYSEHPMPRGQRKERGESWSDLETQSERRPRPPVTSGARDWVLDWFDSIGPQRFERFRYALTHVGRHSYWQRMWVQPELAFARDAILFFGTYTCPIKAMRVVFFALEGFGLDRAKMSTRYSVTETTQSVNSLVALPMKGTLDKLSTGQIKQTRRFFGGFRFQELCKLRCSEPRDRIFAVIPLVDWQGFKVPVLSVDYKRSPLSLAQECIPFCADFWEVKDLLKSLQVGCEHLQLDVRSFLDSRAKSAAAAPWQFPQTGSCQCGDARLADPMYFYCWCYSRIAEDSLENTSSRYKVVKDLSKKGPMTKETKSEIAYVPQATTPGDILLSLPIGNSGAGCEGLVIRQDSRGIYEFIGQAMLKRDYSMQHFSYYPCGFELRLNSGDAMAFALQGSACSAACKSERNNLDADSDLLQRLETPFAVSRYSSYAVDYDDITRSSDRLRPDYVNYKKANRLKKVLCTRCGQLLPTVRSSRLAQTPSHLGPSEQLQSSSDANVSMPAAAVDSISDRVGRATQLAKHTELSNKTSRSTNRGRTFDSPARLQETRYSLAITDFDSQQSVGSGLSRKGSRKLGQARPTSTERDTYARSENLSIRTSVSESNLVPLSEALGPEGLLDVPSINGNDQRAEEQLEKIEPVNVLASTLLGLPSKRASALIPSQWLGARNRRSGMMFVQ